MRSLALFLAGVCMVLAWWAAIEGLFGVAWVSAGCMGLGIFAHLWGADGR